MADVWRRPEDGGDRFLRKVRCLRTKSHTVSSTGVLRVLRTLC